MAREKAKGDGRLDRKADGTEQLQWLLSLTKCLNTWSTMHISI